MNSRRTRREGNVARIGVRKNVYIGLVGKAEEKRLH
jgi:hypothetical protein